MAAYKKLEMVAYIKSQIWSNFQGCMEVIYMHVVVGKKHTVLTLKGLGG
jgi:hypothetical protein